MRPPGRSPLPAMRVLLLLLVWCAGLAAWAAPPSVVVLTVNGAIGPPSADYVHRGLARAARDGAQLVVIQMDTPGGLDTSMRASIKDILASPVPVATYVAPSGARAASAGTYILYASHIAAMAPATNLGAATPVQIGGAEPKPESPSPPKSGTSAADKPPAKDAKASKAINDAAAYIRSLAQLRGRNVEWAERAVREAVSLPATEAVKIKVADLIASDITDLLQQVNGKTFEFQGRKLTLQTEGAAIVRVDADWRTRLLAVITDPSVAYILMLLGVYGLLFEIYSPGLILPGVVGGIALLTGLYALQTLPVNYAGLALIVLGIGFMVGELFVASYGALGLGGVAAFVLGSVMLIDTDVPGYDLPWTLIALVASLSALFLFLVVGMALRARKRPVVTGSEELIGAFGEIAGQTEGQWWARVHGELWKVRSASDLHMGQRVRVEQVDGLVLRVTPTEQNN